MVIIKQKNKKPFTMKRKTDREFAKLLTMSIVLVAFAIFITYQASEFIYKHFGKPIVVRDLLWEILPYIPWMLLVCEIFVVASAVMMIIYGFVNDRDLIPYTIFLVAAFHVIRAFMIILTPMGYPYEYSSFLNGEGLHGAFPSGHLSIPFIIFLITRRKRFFLLSLIVSITLLLSRGHYTIDLIGTVFISYFLVAMSNKYLRKYFKEEG